jgi:hypothetical protein
MRRRLSFGHWSGLVFALVSAFWLGTGCNRPEAPHCLRTAGADTTWQEELSPGTLGKLTVYDRLDVNWHATAAGAPVILAFSGPANLLPHIEVGWSGGEHGELELSDANRCRWVRDLGVRLQVDVYAPDLGGVELRGSGRFAMDTCRRSGTLQIDARQFSGDAHIAVEVDTLRMKMHSGPGSLTGVGHVREVGIFSAGLGAVDARAVRAERAFVNQSGVRELHFQALEYAYVGHYGPGWVWGHGGAPADWDWKRNSDGQLGWKD